VVAFLTQGSIPAVAPTDIYALRRVDTKINIIFLGTCPHILYESFIGVDIDPRSVVLKDKMIFYEPVSQLCHACCISVIQVLTLWYA
jgi:hypothetical protein